MQGGPAVLGPALYESIGEAALIGTLNAWGAGMHRPVPALRPDLSAMQAEVSGPLVHA